MCKGVYLELVFFKELLRELGHEPRNVARQQLFDPVEVFLRQLGELTEVLLGNGEKTR